MKKLFIILSLFTTIASAQQKTISMNDAFMNSALMPQNLKYLQWLPDGVHYSYVGKKNAEECLIISSAKSKNDTVLYAAALNPGVKSLPIFSWLSNEELLFNDGANYKALNYKSKITSTKLVIKDNAANQEWNADKTAMALRLIIICIILIQKNQCRLQMSRTQQL